jgi:hypothetical protein
MLIRAGLVAASMDHPEMQRIRLRHSTPDRDSLDQSVVRESVHQGPAEGAEVATLEEMEQPHRQGSDEQRPGQPAGGLAGLLAAPSADRLEPRTPSLW